MVTQQAQTDETLTPFGEDLPAGGALFHLPPALASTYGPTARYDLRTPLGLIDYAIAFVNRPKRKVTTEELRIGVQLPVGRERLSELLRAVAAHGGALPIPSDATLTALRKYESELHWIPRLERTPSGVQRRHHAFVLSANGFYALVATLIADGVLVDKKHRSLISQCDHCRDLFIVHPRAQHKGRPERKYCGKDCRNAAHADGGPARQRARRARQGAEKLLLEGGVRRSKAREAIKQVSAVHRDATAAQLAIHANTLMQSARKHK